MNSSPVAYIRRSVARRGDPGDVSREFQTAKVRALANGDGAMLRIIDGDWGVSASSDKTVKRLAFLSMLDEIERGEVSHVYAYSPDRLARSVEWSARLVNVCRRAGVPITTTAGTVAPDDPAARAMFNMLAVMNETALDEMERKARASVESRARRGDIMGRRTYGEVRTLKDHRIVGTGEDAALIVATFREAGSYFGAARLLNDRKVPTLSGRQWYPRTVQRIVNREDRSTVPLGQRRGVRAVGTLLFSTLLVCHCGTRMGQTTSSHWAPKYRCPNGVADPHHARPYMVAEPRLIDVMKAEADRLRVPYDDLVLADGDKAQREALEAKRERWIEQYGEGLIDKATRDARLAQVAEAVKALDLAEAVKAIPPTIDWTAAPQVVNSLLRTLWDHVDLGPDLMPVPPSKDRPTGGFVWRVPEWRAPHLVVAK